MGKDAGELREEIDETRGRMGETVDAIAYKADVPSRARDAIGERVETVKSSITGTVDSLRERTRDISVSPPDMSGLQERASGIAGAIKENPLGLLLGAAAVGFLIGSLLPTTELEEERLGPIGEQLREQAKERVQETIGHAREAATQAVNQATQAVTQAINQS